MALNEIQEAAFFRESTTYDSLNTKAGPYFLHTSRHHNVNAYFWYCLSYFLNLNVFKSIDWFPVGRLIKTENIVAAYNEFYSFWAWLYYQISNYCFLISKYIFHCTGYKCTRDLHIQKTCLASFKASNKWKIKVCISTDWLYYCLYFKRIKHSSLKIML